MKLDQCNTVQLVTFVSILFTASELAAQESLPASESLSDTTKESVSDSARTGSPLGPDNAGSAVVNTVATDGKNAIGQNAHNGRSLSQETGARAQPHALEFSELNGRESQHSDTVINIDGSGSSAALRTGDLSEHTDHTVVLGLPRGTVTGNIPEQSDAPVVPGTTENPTMSGQQEQSDESLLPGLSETIGESKPSEEKSRHGITGETAVEGSSLQKELSDACRNVQLTRAVSLNCYYFSE